MTRTPLPTLVAALGSLGAEGGPELVVATAIVAALVNLLLSAGIAYKLYAGYRGTGNRALLAMAVGLLLLTTVPTTMRFAIPTLVGGVPPIQFVLTTVSELLGLLAMLYAVRGPPAKRRRRRRVRVNEAGTAALALGVLGLSVQHLGLVTWSLSAVVGAYVGWLAYRGYRRNDSAPMGYLAAGVLLLTTAPFAAAVVLEFVLAVPDATVLLSNALFHLAGLGSVFHSLTRA